MKKVLSIISMVAVVLLFSVHAFVLNKAGKEEICKATVKGTFNISGSVASVAQQDGMMI